MKCICKWCRSNKEYKDFYEFRKFYHIIDKDYHEVAHYYPHPVYGKDTPDKQLGRFIYHCTFNGYCFAVLGYKSRKEFYTYDETDEYMKKYKGSAFTQDDNQFDELVKKYKEYIRELFQTLLGKDFKINTCRSFRFSSANEYIRSLLYDSFLNKAVTLDSLKINI